jgi:hypothetical protein
VKCVTVEPCDEIDVVRAMTERFNNRRRRRTGRVRIGYEADHRNRLAGTATVEQHQLRIHARVGARSHAGTADSNRYILGHHDVQNSILCLPVGDPGPDGLLDLRIVDLAIDRLAERELQDTQIVFGDATTTATRAGLVPEENLGIKSSACESRLIESKHDNGCITLRRSGPDDCRVAIGRCGWNRRDGIDVARELGPQFLE